MKSTRSAAFHSYRSNLKSGRTRYRSVESKRGSPLVKLASLVGNSNCLRLQDRHRQAQNKSGSMTKVTLTVKRAVHIFYMLFCDAQA